MKKIVLLALVLNTFVFADWGFFGVTDRSYVQINFNGSIAWYDLAATTGNADYQGSNLGAFTSNSDFLKISAWQIKTWKNVGTSDVTSASLYYRIYDNSVGAGSTSFTQVAGGFLANLVAPGDQMWGMGTETSIDITALEGGKTYALELYITVTGTTPNETKYDDNGSSYFKATFTTDGAFPVELNSFSAIPSGESVKLLWQTATEVNNYGFDVERAASQDKSASWENLGFVEGHGNSNSPKDYSFIDTPDNLRSTTQSLYYRLKQIDNDGAISYSDIIEVIVNNTPEEFALSQNYPNPFNPSTIITYSIPKDGIVTLKVYDILGTEVASLVNEQKQAGTHTYRFDAASLPSGTYVYRIQSGEYTQSKKLILLK